MNPRAVRAAFVFLPVTSALMALFAIGLVLVKIRRQPTFAYVAPVAGWAIAGFAVAVLLTFAFRMLARSNDWVEDGAIVSWVVALHAGILLLVVPMLLLTVSTRIDNIPGWEFPVLNKRWLVALYDIAVATFVVFPVAVERWRTNADAEAFQSSARQVLRRYGGRSIVGVIAIAGLAWYLTGPPWNLYRLHRVIDGHEQLHLGPLQAISKGYIPYIGPASMVYGPGSQLLTWWVMRALGRFDIVSFRTAFALCVFAALLAVAVAAYWWLGLTRAVAVVLLACTYSPIAFYFWLADGTFDGFYGWANPLRYLAPLLVVPSLAPVAFNWPYGRLRTPWVVLLGVVWGIGAWFAQENLSATAVAAGMLLAILWLTRTIAFARAVRLLAWLVAGFAIVAVPVLASYAVRGLAGEYVRNYFLNPRAIAMGFSNMWWPPQDVGLPDRYPYFLTMPFTLALAACALWRLRPLRLVSPLDLRRTRFLAFLCVQLVCYQTVLLRSDSTHLRNTMVALPFVLVLGFWDMPGWIAAPGRRRLATRAAFVAIAIMVYPALRAPAWIPMMVKPAAKFRAAPIPAAAAHQESGVAFQRATPLLSNEPRLADNSTVPMRDFLEFASEIHDRVGSRKTYIAALGSINTGLLYFMAALTPAPYPLDLETMTINSELRALVIDHMRTHPGEYECFIGPSLIQTEATVFLASHPGSQTIERKLGQTTIYVVLAPMRG